ncbi:MAG: heavy metal sensor histidine kinase [Chthoniobacterales bacterium]
MSSKPTEPRSIASQLVLLFAVAAALLLFCGLGVLYAIVVRHAFEEDNEVLADKVEALRVDLERGGGPAGLEPELREHRRDERAGYFVRVLDSAGATIAETAGPDGAALPPSSFPAAMDTDQPTPARSIRASGKLFSLVSVVQRAGDQRYTIQVAQDRSADEQFTREFALLVAIVLGVGILAAARIAVRVTRRGLRPLTLMTASLEQIGPHQLHERLTQSGWPRELQPLAAGFDHMLDRLEESFTRLSQFSADLAHELRTPVANIRGESEVALTRSRTPEEYRGVIESTVAECERLSGTIDSLLFLARAAAAERQIVRTRFDGGEALRKIASYYEAVADERQIQLTATGDGELSADPLLIGRAVSNLVDNALRHTPPGGTIAIALRRKGAASEIAVSDTGAGIPSEHLPRVFDRLYRVDASRTSSGSGLGLALVKSIAQLHSGRVRIASEVDRGTTVTLTIPNERP